MPISHIFLALLVAFVWGVNFLFVKIGLEEISPLLLCTLRFTLASVPAIFFIKPPAIPFKLVVSYGLFMFAFQFALLFLGMHAGMTPGMASLLIQVQVFFSMFFATVFLKEQPNPWQIIGALVSFIGIGVVALHFDNNISVLGFILILSSAATWGLGNLITKKATNINMMALVVWGSFVAIVPMLALSLIFEGYDSIVTSYHHLSRRGAAALLYIVYISTWVGYGVWNWLMSRYPVGMIVPFTLLVPVVGILSSVLILGEPLQSWKLVAGLFVISGLCINILSARFLAMRTPQNEPVLQ
ncbi:integral membrane protein [Legionella lansingensis]|uniref:Integral membrane protein n=1 Tax=Legionella lansingensis TaxID=45067 RepID=A0A0W0VUB1_9GAMM|nr:EamA family transporter [Legionella lansingensis]KTD23481.1 integral membrane protein [Legionella lansingensis]SNV50778.1 integral membrane protein [Legionella lansingensis]